MEVTLPQLRSLNHKDLPECLHSKLSYLWKGAHVLATDSLTLSHTFSREFMNLCDENAVDLPEEIRDTFCKYCGVLSLPSFTCSIRIKKASSNINRKQKEGTKYHNEVVKKCLVCPKGLSRTRGCKRGRDLFRSQQGTPAEANEQTAPTTTGNFSFLDADRRKSAPGRLQAVEYIPFSSPAVVIHHPPPATGDKRVNLLELEKARKKQKNTSSAAESKGVSSLSALKSLFGPKN